MSLTRIRCGLVSLGSLALSGCLVETPEEEEPATLSVELVRVDDGVQASFTADVPPGADNVEIWFGDGQISAGELEPTHTYVVNANYRASLFYDDPGGGGRANAEVVIDEIPVPMEALALPDGAGTYLVATNQWSFLHNYQSNEPAFTQLRTSEALAFTLDAEGASTPVQNAIIEFFPTREVSESRSVPLGVAGELAYVDLGDEPHVLIPGWSVGGEQVYEGGFTMPQLDRTEAPEPNVPHFLENADFPMDEELELRLRLRMTGGMHGMSYFLVGREGSKRFDVDNPSGLATVRVSPADLAEIGPGVVGLYTVLYSEIVVDDVTVRNNKVGYAPIRLVVDDG